MKLASQNELNCRFVCLVHMSYQLFYQPGLVAWRSGNAFHPINEVTLLRAGLVLRWVTVCRQVNHLSM